MAWTKEQAKAMAAKGGKASAEARKRLRAEREGKSPEERAKVAITGRLEDVADVLIEAALGEGVFNDLDSKTRLRAATKALAYAFDKPATKGARQEDLPSSEDESTEPQRPEGTKGVPNSPAPIQESHRA